MGRRRILLGLRNGHPWWVTRRRYRQLRIDPSHPDAPHSHPLPRGHVHSKPSRSATLDRHIVYWCHLSLAYAGKMVYTENWTLRQRFFFFVSGHFRGASADCSVFVATLLRWGGVKSVTATDYTGTLLQKGKPIPGPKRGCVAVWGPGTGAHTAFITEHIAGTADWYCVGFGHQGAPDRVTLSGMNAYFRSVGEPGVRFLEFAA